MSTAGAVVFSTADSICDNLLKMEGGQFDTYRALLMVRGPQSGAVSSYFAGEVTSTQRYVEEPQHFKRLNLFAKATAPIRTTGNVGASLMTFSSGWDASWQIPQRAVDAGTITRFGSIDPTEGGATSRTTTNVKYASGGASPLTLTGSFTDYRFRLFSNFTFFANDSLRGDGIEQTDDRSILALRAENDIFYEFADLPMHTRFGATLRNDDIRVALYHDSARVRLEPTVDAAIRQRQIGPYLEQEIILPWAQIMLGRSISRCGHEHRPRSPLCAGAGDGNRHFCGGAAAVVGVRMISSSRALGQAARAFAGPMARLFFFS